MTTPNKTNCNIKVERYAISADTVNCNIYVNGACLFVGLQNNNYTIPLGTYKAVVYKGKHPHERLLLSGIEGHAGVEIHEANRASELKGCIGIGMLFRGNIIFNSIYALANLIDMVKKYDTCTVELCSAILSEENKV